jgi:hypothetical protein
MKIKVKIGAEPSISYQKAAFYIETEIEYTEFEQFKAETEKLQKVVNELAIKQAQELVILTKQ